MTSKFCYVIGNPVEHSLSPEMLNAAFEDLGIDCNYHTLKVEKGELGRKVESLRRASDVIGFNVTVPYKIEVMKYLDSIDGLAKEIGAVNTVVNYQGKLEGFNTDGFGASNALKETIYPKNKVVTTIGAGGAARAVVFTLTKESGVKKIYLLNRTEEKAKELAKSVRIVPDVLDDENLESCLRESDILINCTSIGMYPNDKESPVPKEFLNSKLVVFDIIYNPLETRLLKDALEAGCKIVPGYKMLVYQGYKSFELFTGKKPNVKLMEDVILRKLTGKA